MASINGLSFKVVRGRPSFAGVHTYLVSYAKGGLGEVNFGRGKPAYGGVARGGVDSFPRAVSYLFYCKNEKGEDGIMVPICLPPKSMELLINELHKAMLAPITSVASNL